MSRRESPSIATGGLGEISISQWRVLLAGHLGWLLDGFDVMLYSFALLKIREEFSLTSLQAGALASVTLLASAFGGGVAGFLSDRFGRARVLVVSILLYSVFTGLTATSRSVGELLLWRALVGIGLGAEWASGSVLVSESWPARHRGKAMGFMQSGWALGYIAAAILAAWILPRYGWRTLFALGTLPALVTFWIRRHVPEPRIWRERAKIPEGRSIFAELFSRRYRGRVLVATCLSSVVLFAYWGLFTWVPAYLSSPRENGGAGLSLLMSSSWIIPMECGAFAGYLSFGWLADRFGRRNTFAVFVLCAAVLAPLYGVSAAHEWALLLLGPLLGFFGHGYFSVFGALLSELFPTHIRASAQGLCYNAGRALSAAAPLSIGWFADRNGIGAALGLTSAFFAAGALLIYLLPETSGEELQ